MKTARRVTEILLVLLLCPNPAQAARRPVDYRSHVQGNRVTICATLTTRGCPQPDGMVRQDVNTGQVVRLPQRCVPYEPRVGVRPAPRFRLPCYVDECVPPGEYRYGFGRPLDCRRAGVAYYYTPVRVTSSLAADCRPAAQSTPVARAPWNKAPVVCSRGCCRLGGAPEAQDGLALLLFAALWWWRRRRRRD